VSITVGGVPDELMCSIACCEHVLMLIMLEVQLHAKTRTLTSALHMSCFGYLICLYLPVEVYRPIE